MEERVRKGRERVKGEGGGNKSRGQGAMRMGREKRCVERWWEREKGKLPREALEKLQGIGGERAGDEGGRDVGEGGKFPAEEDGGATQGGL